MFLVASSNAFAGGGGGGGGGGLTDEEMSALCGYAGYAIIALLALVVVYGLGIWATAPCRERYRRARAWRDAMNAPPKDDSPPEPTSTVG